jgi:hypothetical protein
MVTILLPHTVPLGSKQTNATSAIMYQFTGDKTGNRHDSSELVPPLTECVNQMTYR